MANKNQSLIGALLISAAGFLSFFFVLQTYDNLNQLRTAVAERRTLLESRTKIIDDVLKLKQDYDAKKAEIDKISSIIPSRKQLPELVSAFESMASTNGLALNSLNIAENENSSEEDAGNPFKTMNIQNKLNGSYESFRNFLSSVESSRRLIDINTAKLNLEETGEILIEINGRAYILK